MKITIPSIDDFHIHLRNDNRCKIATSLLKSGGVSRGIIMPNIEPNAVENVEQAQIYQKELKKIEPNFDYLMSIKLTPKTTQETIISAVKNGIIIGKQYPTGVTTNSENGVSDINEMYKIYEVMQEYDLPLSLHGEMPKTPVMEAEKAFLPTLEKLTQDFPKLRIIMEHVSTADAVKTICDLSENVVATITPQHLLLTIDDILASKLKPHNYCMPICKTANDRQSLIEIIKLGNKKFFFGSDSAPHFRKNKEGNNASPGIFSSPIIAAILAHIFESNEMLDKLENFTSKFGANFYRLPQNSQMITIEKKSFKIPDNYQEIVPLFANQMIDWQLSD